MKIKTKDLVKTADTKAIRDKADCFQRGDEWYEVEPKWDRKEENTEALKNVIDRYTKKMYYGEPLDLKDIEIKYQYIYYKEFEVTEEGEPIGYVKEDKSALIEEYRSVLIDENELGSVEKMAIFFFIVVIIAVAIYIGLSL